MGGLTGTVAIETGIACGTVGAGGAVGSTVAIVCFPDYLTVGELVGELVSVQVSVFFFSSF